MKTCSQMASGEVLASGGGKPGGGVSAETRGESCVLFWIHTVPRRTEHELDLRNYPGPHPQKHLDGVELDASPKFPEIPPCQLPVSPKRLERRV